MAKDPDDRYPSAARLAAAARAAVGSLPAEKAGAPRTTISPPRSPGEPVGPLPASTEPPPVPRAHHALTDSRRFSRVGSAISMALGPALVTTGSLLLLDFPDRDRHPSAFLEYIASHADRHQAAALVTVVGLLIGLWGLIGVAHILRNRRLAAGQLGAALMIVSAFLVNSYSFAVVIGGAERSGVDRGQLTALLGHARSSGWLGIVRLAMLISVLGLILLAVGLVLRRATALWIPVLLTLAAVERSVLAETGLALSQRMFAVLDMLLFAIPAAGLAARMLRMSDEEWGRWIPLDGLLARAGDASPGERGPLTSDPSDSTPRRSLKRS
jgi:hypothetical protein